MDKERGFYAEEEKTEGEWGRGSNLGLSNSLNREETFCVTLIRHPPFAGATFPQGKARTRKRVVFPKSQKAILAFGINNMWAFLILLPSPGGRWHAKGVTDEGYTSPFRLVPSARQTSIYPSSHHGGVLHLIRDLPDGRADQADPDPADGQIHEAVAVGEDLVDRGDHGIQGILILGAAVRDREL